MTSVIVPAHDEETTIAACLRSLAGRPGSDRQIVVVCNGCTDGTAEAARRAAPRAKVIELAVASKTAALNAGDAVATSFPRLYVDADVRLAPGAVERLVGALEAGAPAVSPRPMFEVGASPWIVRSYLQFWGNLPRVRGGLVGAGAYGLSRAGRARFEAFPDVVADDYYVQQQFAPHERLLVEDARTIVRAPRSLDALVARKRRIITGNREVDRRAADDHRAARWRGWLQMAARRPWVLADLPAFAAVTVLAHVRMRHGSVRWERDTTTR